MRIETGQISCRDESQRAQHRAVREKRPDPENSIDRGSQDSMRP
jgi:hypothetical protein